MNQTRRNFLRTLAAAPIAAVAAAQADDRTEKAREAYRKEMTGFVSAEFVRDLNGYYIVNCCPVPPRSITITSHTSP